MVTLGEVYDRLERSPPRDRRVSIYLVELSSASDFS